MVSFSVKKLIQHAAAVMRSLPTTEHYLISPSRIFLSGQGKKMPGYLGGGGGGNLVAWPSEVG